MLGHVSDALHAGCSSVSIIPSDDALLVMPGRQLRALARTHGVGHHCYAGYADMRAKLSMLRDHSIAVCLECQDGVIRPLYREYKSCLPKSQPEHLSLLYVCMHRLHRRISTLWTLTPVHLSLINFSMQVPRVFQQGAEEW
jgi:hypothetical protein